MKTIAIFGGNQEKTFEKIGNKNGCKVLFHNGKNRKSGTKSEFENIIKKADIVVVLYGACAHVSMDCVKEVSKKLDKNLIFHKGKGASGAIQKCIQKLNTQTAA